MMTTSSCPTAAMAMAMIVIAANWLQVAGVLRGGGLGGAAVAVAFAAAVSGRRAVLASALHAAIVAVAGAGAALVGKCAAVFPPRKALGVSTWTWRRV